MKKEEALRLVFKTSEALFPKYKERAAEALQVLGEEADPLFLELQENIEQSLPGIMDQPLEMQEWLKAKIQIYLKQVHSIVERATFMMGLALAIKGGLNEPEPIVPPHLLKDFSAN